MECGNSLPLWQVATCRDQIRSCEETTEPRRRMPKRSQVAALQNLVSTQKKVGKRDPAFRAARQVRARAPVFPVSSAYISRLPQNQSRHDRIPPLLASPGALSG